MRQGRVLQRKMVEALENRERAAFLTVKEIKSLRSGFDLSLLKLSEIA